MTMPRRKASILLLVVLVVSFANGFLVPSPPIRVAVKKPVQWVNKNGVDGSSTKQRNHPSRRVHVISLSASAKDNQDNDSPSLSINPYFASAWIGLVTWAFTIAPGSIGSPQDTAMIQAILENPVSPGINELYYTFFNFFATIPVILAAIALPQGRRSGLPAAPFMVATALIGYFAAGPYLALRPTPRSSLTNGEMVGGFTRHVLENKAVSWFILAFTMYLPVAAQVIPAYQTDPVALWNGFVELVTTSRGAAVSMVDIVLLYISAVALTPRDYRLRQPEASDEEVRNVALATAVLPIVGSALYCALRPALPETSED